MRAGADEDASGSAFQLLYQTYWYPLYAYVRRRGNAHPDAMDLTQGFFTQLLENRGIAKVHPERGRFRAFLLASLKNYICNEWRNQNTQRRGGEWRAISINSTDFERRFQEQLADHESPERQFDRNWVESLLRQVLERLQADYEQAGRAELYTALHQYLVLNDDRIPQAEIAKQLGLSIPAVRMSVYRIRKQYGQLLREAIAHTVDSPEDVEDELNKLIGLMRC